MKLIINININSATAPKCARAAKDEPVTALAILTLFLTGPAAAAPPWQKLYRRPEKDRGMLAVWADDAGWFAAGPGLLVTGAPDGVKTQSLGERSIVAFSGASRAELFAVGWDELILRLDGANWVSEHIALGLPKGGKGHGRNAGDLLQGVVTLPRKPQPVVAAVGPALLLTRHPDGFWQLPTEPDRQAASLLAQKGPPEAPPQGCALASWSWVARDRGVFTCHDGRSFVFDAGKATPAGKLPRACQQAVDRARVHGSTAYTLCADQLWRSDGARWQQVPGPGKMRDFAITDRCLYAVTDRDVWRRCSP
jgi:hypothetical protein